MTGCPGMASRFPLPASRFPWPVPLLTSCLVAGLISCEGDGEGVDEDWLRAGEHSGSTELASLPHEVSEMLATAEWKEPLDGTEIVYAQMRLRDAEVNAVLLVEETGLLTEEDRQRMLRPWLYLHEEWVYEEVVRAHEVGGVYVLDTYQVVRRHNAHPVAAFDPAADVGPPHVEEKVVDLGVAHGPEMLLLHVKVRGFPELDVPLVGGGPSVLEGEALKAVQAQAAVRTAERDALLGERIDLLIADLHDAGWIAVPEGRFSKIGWFGLWVPGDALPLLMARDDLAEIEAELLGEGGPAMDLGNTRQPSRLDAQRYLDSGYDGEQPNPNVHSYGDITVAIIEQDDFEDEACMFFDGANCTGPSRIYGRYSCDNAGTSNRCQPISNFSDGGIIEGAARHGTLVASTLLGDYTDNQGCGFRTRRS